MPQPSPVDSAVRDVVVRVLAEYEAGVAEIRQEYGQKAGMWFTEVEPRRSGAAPLSLSFDGQDLLNVNVGPTWFEVFPFGADDGSLTYLEGIVRAVTGGRVEESGSWWASFARIHTDNGTITVGHMHMPWPWRRRQVREYEPYDDRP